MDLPAATGPYARPGGVVNPDFLLLEDLELRLLLAGGSFSASSRSFPKRCGVSKLSSEKTRLEEGFLDFCDFETLSRKFSVILKINTETLLYK